MKFIKCILNILYLNFKLFYNSKIKKKKTIIFYHPNKDLILIHVNFIEKLLLNKNFCCVFLHQNLIVKRKNYYFVIDYFCSFLFNADIFRYTQIN